MWRSEVNFVESVLSSLLYMDSRVWTDVFSIADEALYPLSHPTRLLIGFLYTINIDDPDCMLYFIICLCPTSLPDQQAMNWETTLVQTIADLLLSEKWSV